MLQGQGISEDEIRTGTRPYTPQARGTLRVQTNLVEVGVVVRDASGKPVAGLKQSDFQVLDNGKLQAISAFSVETRESRIASVGTPPAAAAAGENPGPPPAAALRRALFR